MTQKPSMKKSAVICIPFSTPFLPLALGFANKEARGGFGYGNRETGGLVPAVEELFSFFAQKASGGSMVEIEIEDQGYRLARSISFHPTNPDMRAFNLTGRGNTGTSIPSNIMMPGKCEWRSLYFRISGGSIWDMPSSRDAEEKKRQLVEYLHLFSIIFVYGGVSDAKNALIGDDKWEM